MKPLKMQLAKKEGEHERKCRRSFALKLGIMREFRVGEGCTGSKAKNGLLRAYVHAHMHGNVGLIPPDIPQMH